MVILSENLVGEKRHEFSVAELPNGVYFWKWVGTPGGKIASGKILVLR
jgi:hypothetical protein